MSDRKLDLTAVGYVFYKNKLLFIHHTKLNMWLPPGGHIDANETPDDAALREVKEETGVNAELIDVFNTSIGPFPHFVRENPAPFYSNVHSVGDHDHWGACYLCKTNSDQVSRQEIEIKSHRWLTREEVTNDSAIREDIKAIALKAFDLWEKYMTPRQ